jgi:hypothetical protein
VTPEAEAGIVSAFEYINEPSPENAAKWLRGLYREIDTLETTPERCSLARENEYFEGAFGQRERAHPAHRVLGWPFRGHRDLGGPDEGFGLKVVSADEVPMDSRSSLILRHGDRRYNTSPGAATRRAQTPWRLSSAERDPAHSWS